MTAPAAHWPSCVEKNVWTAVPPNLRSRPGSLEDYTLKLRKVDPISALRAREVLTFHLVGCAGNFDDHDPQRRVAEALTAQAHDPQRPVAVLASPAARAAFLYHLGDVTYKPGDDDNDATDDQPPGWNQSDMYNDQFYAPYRHYPQAIFAVAGNHDGKLRPKAAHSSLPHFLNNFCAPQAHTTADNRTDGRRAMTQPYIYWRLDTPLAYIIGLYTNVANGGILDDPATPDLRPQFDWLVAQLQDVRARNAGDATPKAIIVACHYPPYSGEVQFVQRGDPTLGPTGAHAALPLGLVLREAYQASGQRPDLVVSAHVHNYERLIYRYTDPNVVWEIPHLIVGCGGHAVESLGERCDKSLGPVPPLPFDAFHPPGLTLPAGESVQVVSYEDQHYGFMRLTIAENTRLLTGEFFTVTEQSTELADTFRLDLRRHQVL